MAVHMRWEIHVRVPWWVHIGCMTDTASNFSTLTRGVLLDIADLPAKDDYPASLVATIHVRTARGGGYSMRLFGPALASLRGVAPYTEVEIGWDPSASPTDRAAHRCRVIAARPLGSPSGGK